MKISIAMATYNGASYLSDQLQSFLEQSRLPNELIISDDGSTDNTLEILENFASSAPFVVKIFSNPGKKGYSSNFNNAISRTSGEFVFLSDQDDFWHSEKISTIIQISDKFPNYLLYIHDADICDQKLQPLGFTKLEQIRSSGLTEDFLVMGCCCAIKKELLSSCMPIDKEYGSHDKWLVKFSEAFGAKYICEQSLINYRRHDTNESKSVLNSKRKLTKATFLFSQIVNCFKQNNLKYSIYQYQQNSILLTRLRSTADHANVRYAKTIRDYCTKFFKETQTIYERIEIKKKNRLNRIYFIVRYWARGGYKSSHGIYSAFQDFIC